MTKCISIHIIKRFKTHIDDRYIVYCSSVQKHLTVFEDIRTARGVVCYLVNDDGVSRRNDV